jgi:hypothetical protein
LIRSAYIKPKLYWKIIMSQITEFSPAIITVSGATKLEKQLSVVNYASPSTRMALANATGKMGIAARNGIANGGLNGIAKQSSMGNYKPAAEYFAARLGQGFVISSRSTFESLADQMEARIMQAKSAKNGGYVTDKKTGGQKPSAAHALALELKAISVELVSVAADFATQGRTAITA